MAERGGNEVAGMASGRGSAILSLLLAIILAGAVIAAVWQLKAAIAPWLLVAGGLLSFAGLYAIFGFVAGLIRFESRSQNRAFHAFRPARSSPSASGFVWGYETPLRVESLA